MVIQNHKQRNWEEMITRSGNNGQTIHRRHKWTVQLPLTAFKLPHQRYTMECIAARYHFPDRAWWDTRTVPEHVSPNRIRNHPEHIAEYGSTIRTILPRMVRYVVENFNPIAVWLLGSVARGDCNMHSDVDLMIVMPEGTDMRTIAVDIRMVLTRAPLPKDVMVTTPERFKRRASDISTWEHQALRDGVLLYG